MDEIAISKFKATCLAVLERVRKTGEPVRVTRFGEPVAEILPPKAESLPARKLGWAEGQLGLTDYDEIIKAQLWDDDHTVREWDEIEAQHAEKERLARKSKRAKP